MEIDDLAVIRVGAFFGARYKVFQAGVELLIPLLQLIVALHNFAGLSCCFLRNEHHCCLYCAAELVRKNGVLC